MTETIYHSCLVGYDDYDRPQVSVTKVRKARKTYKCEECNAEIHPGESYEHHRALWDGMWGTVRTCEVCMNIRNSIFINGCVVGEMWYMIHNEFCGYDDDDNEMCICP